MIHLPPDEPPDRPDDRPARAAPYEDKTTDLETAIAAAVPDGASVAFGGMGGRDPEAVAREIVRQGITGLRVLDDARTTLLDVMVGAGAVDEYVGSWVGTSLISQGHNLRRAVEDDIPHHLSMTDVSNFGSSLMFFAGAMDVPFVPTRSMLGTDIPEYNDAIEVIEDPMGSGDDLALVPAATPDVAVVHVQRCDRFGNAQILGNVVNDHLKARAADRVVITCEEVVPTDVVRASPELTRIPYYLVDRVVEVPYGSHPWHCYGHYYADLPFYREYGLQSRDREGFEEWLDEWLLPHEEYLEKLGPDRLARLAEMEQVINGDTTDRTDVPGPEPGPSTAPAGGPDRGVDRAPGTDPGPDPDRVPDADPDADPNPDARDDARTDL